MDYIPNNINFRIVSSKAISQFKADQSFDFNELVAGGYEFTKSSKEILLLNYEFWFKWIIRTEKIFIGNHSNRSMDHMSGWIISSVNEIQNEIEDVILTHPKTFDKDQRSILAKTHSVFVEYLKLELKEYLRDSIYISFPKIVKIVSDVLHNLLFELHEYEEINKDRSHAFLSLTPECFSIKEKMGLYPLIIRATIYKEVFGTTKFCLKNYTDLEEMDSRCQEEMEKHCINLIIDGKSESISKG